MIRLYNFIEGNEFNQSMKYRRSAFAESDKHACDRLSHEFGFSVLKVPHLACSPRKECRQQRPLPTSELCRRARAGALPP